MATYRDIASTETDPDSPVTATLMVALAENPLALSQMAATAITAGEVNAAQFYQHALVTGTGDTDALIYDNAVDGNVAEVEFDLGTDKLTGFEYELSMVEFSADGTDTSIGLEMRFFKETSATWTAWTRVAFPFSNVSASSGKIRFALMPDNRYLFVSAIVDISLTGAVGTTIDLSSAQNVTKCAIRLETYNFDLGKFYMYKRATYVGRE